MHLDHVVTHLGWTAVWVNKILTSHLDRLICFGKLNGIHQALVPSLTVGVRHTHQVRCLQEKIHPYQELPLTVIAYPSIDILEINTLNTFLNHKTCFLSFPTCPAASVRPHKAFEADPTQSPNAGTSPILQFWEIPAMDSPRTWTRQWASKTKRGEREECLAC